MNKLTIISLSILIILTGIVAGFYFKISSKARNLETRIKQTQNEISRFETQSTEQPNIECLRQIKNHHEELKDLLLETRNFYSDIALAESVLKPLEFKEKLAEVNENYSRYKIPIPEGFGFKEYQGFNLPLFSQMPQLTRQLAFIVQMIDLLIGNNVEAITDIKRLPVEDVKSSSETSFLSYPFEFSFSMDHKNFLELWKSLVLFPSIIKIQKLALESNYTPGDDSLESQLILAKMELCLVEHQQ